MANIKDFIKKIGNSAVSLEEQQQALAQVEQTIIEAKQKRTEAVGKNADMVIQALKTIEAKLEAKLTELNNTPAKQGIQGPTGKAGKDGKNGQDGRDGINGKDGTDGKDGVDGKDGISVVDAKIDFDGSLVVYLSNGNEIDCGQILSPDVAQNIIINSGGSGTSQTVTDTLVSLQNQINTLTGIDGVLGDMAQQNANAVAITGGTINGTTIGATTPSTVNATTITGQTARLNGTGQNFFTQSQDYTQAAWSKTGVTITAASITAPNGTLTGQTLNEDTSTGQHNINRGGGSEVLSVGATYTMSVYAKQAGRSVIFIQALGTFAKSYFDIANGTVLSSGSGMTSTITSVGDGWYRCAVTFVCDSTNNSIRVIAATTGNGVQTYTGTGIASVYLWGAQMELGSTANTYIPTTTTAVYGTPTLSFSGVSTIGLESNGALFVQPAGTGALQAQATTSTTAGGNARGANAVDFQTLRDFATKVASGTASVICGGRYNQASGGQSVTVGGNNIISSGSQAFSGGGSDNTNAGQLGFLGGGYSNNISSNGQFGVLGGGYSNTLAGFYNVIGGGFTNSGTSGSAVTTQSGTMNATTAVTLSGSNASIKVGQLITGTSIQSFPATYVAAISGTSLTLSQNASGSSTSTLSFFTPHGVVVGGGNNQATGSYSFIGGGGDAGTAANRNTASGDWSFVGGGIKNTASGFSSVVCGGGWNGTTVAGNNATGAASGVLTGLNNLASGTSSAVLGGGNSQATGANDLSGGNTCIASGGDSAALGGRQNLANSVRSVVVGGNRGTARSIAGAAIFSSQDRAIADVSGISQSMLLILGRQTTDATATALTSDLNSASTTNQVILPNNSAYFFTGEVVSGVTGGGNTKGWTIEGVIKRGANAASTALVGTPTVTSTYADAGASTWTIAVTADTTNGGLRVTFTGQASTTIRTVCQLRTTEMTY